MLIVIAEILIVAAVILVLYHLRQYFGLSLVYVFLGANQYFQTMQVSTVHVDLLGRFPVSPGSAALFTSTLFAVLLIYLREGVPCTRRLIYGVLLANVSLVTLTMITRFGLTNGYLIAHSEYSRAFYDIHIFAFGFGTALLLFDAVLLVFLYEGISLRFRALPLLARIVLSLLIVLCFDSVVFVSSWFAGSPEYTDILVGNILGKSFSGLLYGLILWGYLSVFPSVHSRAADFAPKDMTDVFSIVTYRDRYRALQDRTAKKEAAYAEERREVREKLKNTQEELRHAQKMESIGQLAGGVAHDFNNILTAILGYSDLIIESPDTPETTGAYAREVKTAAKRAAELTHQLLAFSRKQILSPRVLNVNEMIESIADMLRRLLGERIRLKFDLSPAVPRICADNTQLQQVILNLVINSRDAMPDGGLLKIETRSLQLPGESGVTNGRLDPGPYVCISVIDSGVGIDEETQRRIFEPFFTTKDVGKGTGLGLSTVYGVIEQSGGWVYVESEPGKGATFRVLLPATTKEFSETPETEDPLRSLFTGRVLVVEDDMAVAALTRALLQEEGFEVLLASDGPTALELLSAGEPFDLLLTDIVLPGMDGCEVAARATEFAPDIAVILMTGYADEETFQRGDNLTLLRKPYDPQEFLRVVHQQLDKRLRQRTVTAATNHQSQEHE